jgi:hypothetical protein
MPSPESPQEPIRNADAEFHDTVHQLRALARLAVKDGFDPVPRPVQPELLGGIPSGHIAFQMGFEQPPEES